MNAKTIIYDREKNILTTYDKFIKLPYVAELAEELGLMPTTWTEQAAAFGRVIKFRSYRQAFLDLCPDYIRPNWTE